MWRDPITTGRHILKFCKRLTLICTSVVVILPLLGIALARIELLSSGIGMLALPIASLFAIAGLLGGMIGGVVCLVRKVSTFLATFVLCMTVCAAFLIYILVSWSKGAEYPIINDITTDLEDPPEFVAVLEYRGEDSGSLDMLQHEKEIQAKHYPDVKTLESEMNPTDAFQRSLEMANNMGWDVIAADESTGRIEAIVTTLVYGFKDDVVVRITPNHNTGGSYIDLRSTSRVGLADMGANANRIRRFLDEFVDEG